MNIRNLLSGTEQKPNYFSSMKINIGSDMIDILSLRHTMHYVPILLTFEYVYAYAYYSSFDHTERRCGNMNLMLCMTSAADTRAS